MILRTLALAAFLIVNLYSQELAVNPVAVAAVAIGAKSNVGGKRDVDPGVQVSDAMKTYAFDLTWPEGTLYRWKNKASDIGLSLYSLDFTAPIECIDEASYGVKEVAGCLTIAGTDHGHLVVPPGEIDSIDPIVWFLDNEFPDGYKVWQTRKMKLSQVMGNLVVQK